MSTPSNPNNAGGDVTIESREELEQQKPLGEYNYYATELRASLKMLRQWHKTADKVTQKFLGKGHNKGDAGAVDSFRLNLFHSNIKTLQSMMYGNTPKIDVTRTHVDSSDDIARVAGNTLSRLLNLDVQDNGAEVDAVMRAVLQDRLLGGLGCARARYEVETGTGEDGTESLIREDAPIEYYHWGDVAWSWARSWAEIRWIGFRSYIDKDAAVKRFGEDIANDLNYKAQTSTASDDSERDNTEDSAWMKAEIWEVWDKQKRKVVWLSLDHAGLLDQKDDPLQLQGFFPCPPFMLANATTSLYMPTPDYKLAEDLYNEIDILQERIASITRAVKVVGVYDASADGIKTMLNDGIDNQLVPVENWALFGEKGGLKGQIDWMPLKDIVDALDKLRELRSEAIGLLQQVTGMADIMRGDLGSAYEGVGQTQIKAKFGSVRIQALQDEFAQFVTDLFQIKAEIISRHFSPETIAQRSNMQFSADVQILPKAIELIQRPREAQLRVKIRPESVAMVDYAQLKSERTEFLTAISTFMQSAAPLMENDPNAKPFLLQLLQWGLAGFKGASEIEGVVDRAIEASQQQAENPRPNPAQAQAQMEAQIAMQMEQAKQQGEMQKIQAKAQADMQLREQDFQLDMQLAMQEHQNKLAEINADMQRALAENNAKLQADLLTEKAQTESNIASTQATMQGEIQKDVVEAEINMATESHKTASELAKIEAQASAKIREGKAAAAAKPEKSDDD